MATGDDILKAIKDLDMKVDKNHREVKKTLFGSDGMAGMLRCMVDLESTVCGVKDIPDDRGLVGDVKDIKVSIDGNGKEGLKSTVIKTSVGLKRAWYFLGGISMAIIIAAVYIIRSGVLAAAAKGVGGP